VIEINKLLKHKEIFYNIKKKLLWIKIQFDFTEIKILSKIKNYVKLNDKKCFFI